MANLNKVLLMGNLTRDPEMRVTPGGHSICKFGLAINRTWRDREGNQQNDTTFVDVDAFGKQAEVISKYMTKGRGIFVEGRLRLDQWETNTGDKRNKMMVVLENFQFVGGRGDSDSSSSGHDSSQGGDSPYEENSPPSRPASSQAPAAKPAPKDNIDDDVPF